MGNKEICECLRIECQGYKYWDLDPFSLEIYGEEEDMFGCDADFHDRAMDI